MGKITAAGWHTAPCPERASLADLLDRWQSSAADEDLVRVLRQVTPVAGTVIGLTLRGRGIRDPASADEALARVFDHLRRLARPETGERPVHRFEPRAARTRSAQGGDAGVAYIRWLARERALDVARLRSRERREAVTLSVFAVRSGSRPLQFVAPPVAADDDDLQPDRVALLRAALDRLEPRQRQVIELLLEGKCQVTIAHVLGVCAGTVCRLRARAIASLRRLLVT